MFAFTIIKQQARTIVQDEGGAGNGEIVEIAAFNNCTDWLFDADNNVQIQVMKGKIKLKTENNEVVVQEGESYVVPRRSEYRIFSDENTNYRRTPLAQGPGTQRGNQFITVGLR